MKKYVALKRAHLAIPRDGGRGGDTWGAAQCLKGQTGAKLQLSPCGQLPSCHPLARTVCACSFGESPVRPLPAIGLSRSLKPGALPVPWGERSQPRLCIAPMRSAPAPGPELPPRLPRIRTPRGKHLARREVPTTLVLFGGAFLQANLIDLLFPLLSFQAPEPSGWCATKLPSMSGYLSSSRFMPARWHQQLVFLHRHPSKTPAPSKSHSLTATAGPQLASRKGPNSRGVNADGECQDSFGKGRKVWFLLCDKASRTPPDMLHSVPALVNNYLQMNTKAALMVRALPGSGMLH